MSKPDPPTPPNPIDTAKAQTSTNVGTAIAQQFMNNTNQVTPEGSLNYDWTSTFQWRDPTTGSVYDIPRFTATQTYSPQQQAIRNATAGAQQNLAGMAQDQSAALRNLLSTEVDLEGAPFAANGDWLRFTGAPQYTYGDVGPLQRSLGDYGAPQSTFGEAGDITRTYGPGDGFSADRSRVEEALYGRLNPQLDRERANIEQRLADQGIRYGSQAYAHAMDDYNRQANDMRLAVTQQGGAEQQRLMDMEAKRAGFENMAQAQAYQQALGRGTFANQAQQQQFQQGLQAGTFANEAQREAYQQEALRAQFSNAASAQHAQVWQQAFNAQNASRNQYIQEQYAKRNQPINEISALLSGSQVSNPNFVNTPTGQIANTDIAGIINNRFSQDLDTYKQQSQNFNSTMGGIFGLLGGIGRGFLSDRREKQDIDRVGTVFAAGPDGEAPLPIYEYAYKRDPSGARYTGPMAQDVERIDRRAVRERGGRKYIDTTRMGSILKAA